MSEENIKSEDYISIPGFKKIVIFLLRSFFSLFRLIVDVIRSSKILLACGLVTGLIVGYSYYNTRPKYYEVSMITESALLNKRTIAEMVDQLNQLVKTGSTTKLASELQISEREARQLIAIEALNFDNDPLEKDTSTRKHQPFKINAAIKENDLADKMQTALVSYFNNKPSLKKIQEDKKEIYQQKLVFIDKELAKLDTLKTDYNKFLANSKISVTIYNNAFDPAKIYEQSLKLMEEKEKILEWQSTDAQPILVIDEFKSTLAPQSASMSKSLVLGCAAFVGFSFILGLLFVLEKRIRKYQ